MAQASQKGRTLKGRIGKQFSEVDKKQMLINVAWGMLLFPSIYYCLVKKIGLWYISKIFATDRLLHRINEAVGLANFQFEGRQKFSLSETHPLSLLLL